jgi:hypothetical protein
MTMKTLLLATTTVMALVARSALAGGGDGDDHLRQWALAVEHHDAEIAVAANLNNSTPYKVAGPTTAGSTNPRSPSPDKR